MGVIAGITSTISADGIASQMISYRNPKLVHDSDFIEGKDFSKAAGSDDTTEARTHKLLLNDFSTLGLLGTNNLFYDSDLYSFDEIGKDCYSYLL